MNWGSIILAGLLATVVQTVIEAGGRGTGTTRMGLPFMLGTMVTPDRSRAPVVGIIAHMMIGVAFALVYGLIFEAWKAGWWRGLIIGFVHGLFTLTVIMPMMPSFHPRMAGDTQGPEPTPLLEPPGFMAINYGRMTTLVTLVAHSAYGAIIGFFYEPVGA